jgi:hypothetical protein
MTFVPPDPHRGIEMISDFVTWARELARSNPQDERLATALAEIETGLSHIEAGCGMLADRIKKGF